MGYFTLDTPPTWAPNAYATEQGWVDSVTGELLVAIRGLATRRATGATAVSASFTTTSSKTKLKTDDVITLTVKFNEKVTVTGTPQLSVTIGGNTRQASYTTGTGTTNLVFAYTIVSGDTGNWTAIGSSISLNSGTIKDTNDGTTNAVLTGVGALFASTSGYSVDNAAPTAGDVVIYGGAKFTTGAVIRFKVPYSETVTVTGTPLLDFTIDGNAKQASYTDSDGGDVFFEYTVESGDSCAATEFLLTGTIDLDGGTILDAAGNSAPITGLAAETFIESIFINTGAAAGSATVSSVSASGATYGIGDSFDISVQFSQRVGLVTGTPLFNFLIDGVAAQASYVSGQGTTTLVFRYTVAEGDNAASGEVTYAANPIDLNGGTIVNSSLTAVTTTKTGATFTSVIFDGSYPTVVGSSFTAAEHPSYATDDVLQLTIEYSSAITVAGGTPSIVIGIGDIERTLDYASGSGSTELVFEYTVVAGDVAQIPGQGFAINNIIDLNGATMRDAGGNDAPTLFRRPAKTLMTFNA